MELTKIAWLRDLVITVFEYSAVYADKSVIPILCLGRICKCLSDMSHVMRKLDFAYAKTKVQISCAVTAQRICTFVFATRIVPFLLYLFPKFQDCSHFLCLHRPVCFDQAWLETPKTGFSRVAAHLIKVFIFFSLSLL